MNIRLFSTCIKYIKEEGDLINLCKDCTHFKKDTFYFPFSKYRFTFGKCTKVYHLNLISGEKTYNYASTIRDHECLGKWFTKRNSTF